MKTAGLKTGLKLVSILNFQDDSDFFLRFFQLASAI